MEKEVINHFQKVTEDLIGGLSNLTEHHLNKTPFAGSWTAGQVGDHLLKSYSSWTIFSGKTKKTKRPIDENCDSLSKLFLDFTIKMEADPSDFNYPTDEFIKKDYLLAEIQNTSNNIINYSNENDLGLICVDFEFPTFGHLTKFEWLHFYKVHTQRHLKQLKNIVENLKKQEMEKSLTVRKEGVIDANPTEIWEIITTPDYFDKWMFVPGTTSDDEPFGLGSKIEWVNDKGIAYLTGEVIEFIPAEKLVISMQDISWKTKVQKGTVTYEFHLIQTEKGTKVKFHLGDLSIDSEGQLWFDAYNSNDEIGAINKLIERKRNKRTTTR